MHSPATPAEDPVRDLIQAHLTARHYGPCVAAAAALRVPAVLTREADLPAAAAAAIAQGFGLLDTARGAMATACVEAVLAGAADAVLDRAAPEPLMTWCIAAAEWCERHGLDPPFAALQARAAAADAQAPRWTRVHWRIAAAWHHESFGRFAEVPRLLAEAAALAEGSDAALAVPVALKQARLALARLEPEAALARAAQVEARADPARDPLWLADAADVRARAALVRGDFAAALHAARRCDGLARLAQAPPAFTVTFRANEAYALLGLGQVEAAAGLARDLAAAPMPAHMACRTALLADVFALLRDERRGGWGRGPHARLAETMASLRRLDWTGVLALLPGEVARLWAHALDAGIETDWTRSAVRSRGLAPPAPAWPRAWPWRVSLQVLGPFELETDPPQAAAGKAASRPLDLLRQLAAQAGLDPCPADALAAALWPGEGRVGREKALEVTLARLRRLLGDPSAVLLQDRRLRLNPALVWLDKVALERALQALAAGPDTAGEDACTARWREALGLWRGPLLADAGPDDAVPPWLQDARSQLRRRMAAALLAHAAGPGHAARRLQATAADPALARWL